MGIKLRFFLGLAIVATVALLSWRLDVVTDERDQALKDVGALEQSNSQLETSLADQRRENDELQQSYQNEQSEVAKLVRQLKTKQSDALARQRKVYEAAKQSDCASQPLPDELIRLRRERTTAKSGG